MLDTARLIHRLLHPRETQRLVRAARDQDWIFRRQRNLQHVTRD